MYIKHVQVEEGILHAVLAGPFELTQAQHQLIDGRQMTGKPTDFERFLYGEFVASATLDVLFRHNVRLKFAYVIHEPLRDPKRYGETVAVKGGMDVKTFEDKNEALEWLKDQ